MTITEQDIQNVIKEERVYKIGEKTTCVVLILHTGFEVVGTASCVVAADYDEEIGKKYAREKAIDKVWELLGFYKQTSVWERETTKALLFEKHYAKETTMKDFLSK